MADTKPEAAAPNVKVEEYHLKEIETQLLVIVRNNQNAVFSAILSTLAADRLGYKVTERTQFELNPQLDTIKISELPEPPVPVAKAGDAPADGTPPTEPAAPPTPPEEPKTGAVAAA